MITRKQLTVRGTATVFAALLSIALAEVRAATGPVSFNDTSWRVLAIGAGGFLTGIDISPDGSMRIVRTDTYGAYVWSARNVRWEQLVTSRSMPTVDVGVDKSEGVYEIRVAPSLPSRLYMAYRGWVYRSDDRGAHWMRTNFAQVFMDPNDSFRTLGEKMAVDPRNPDVVYVGTPRDGLLVTTDGGVLWTTVGSIPRSAAASDGLSPGISGIAFDPHSAASAGKTTTIYVSSYGNGVYRSADGGRTWARLDGGPRGVNSGKIAPDGAYYAAGEDGTLWRWLNGSWTNITPHRASWHTVIVDPFDAHRVVAATDGGALVFSADQGATWQAAPRQNRRVATDVPWLAWTNESYMSVGDMLFDPLTPNRIWFAEGIGVWYTDIAQGAPSHEPVTFTSESAGIEQLVANDILAPPDGRPLVASWDRPVFLIQDPAVFPFKHGPDNDNEIVMGWALDYASTKPSFIVGLFNWWNVEKSSYSQDGGRTWAPFPTYPLTLASKKIGGSIAVSTPLNIVWVPSNNSAPFYTEDGGMTWMPISIDGAAPTGETGWGSAYYLKRHIAAADRVLPRTFYVYNNSKGLYRSSDGGKSWTLVHAGEIAPFSQYNAKLKTVPGRAGHLFFTSGPQGGPDDWHPAKNPFMRSTDGGKTWTAVADVFEVRAFGFGKPLIDYPTIFIAGWVHNKYGIWRSGDNTQTWVQIGEYPLESLDGVAAIEGDKNVAGTVYLGFNGSGYAFGTMRR